MSNVLGVFCRYPEPGQVKTRLARTIGETSASFLYTAFLTDIFAHLKFRAEREEVSKPVRGRGVGLPACGVPARNELMAGREACPTSALKLPRVVLAYTPDDAISRLWFEQCFGNAAERWPQPSGSLGERLAAFFHSPAAAAERVVVIGSDSPSLPVEYIARAYQLLDEADVVLGPATDGGYYLIGARQGASPGSSPWTDTLFESIDWSGPDVLKQTISRTVNAGRSYSLLPPWYDVDTIDDLNQLRANLAALESAGIDSPCPRTVYVLSTL